MRRHRTDADRGRARHVLGHTVTTDPTAPSALGGGHATAGITAPAAAWAFAEGQQGALRGLRAAATNVLLWQSRPFPLAVQAVFVREDGTGIVRTLCSGDRPRQHLDRALSELKGQRFATFLKSVASTDPACPAAASSRSSPNAPFTPARLPVRHVNIGTPWTGPIATPPQVPDPGPAGALTVEGIDSNQNSVRDDVERFIALRDSSPQSSWR